MQATTGEAQEENQQDQADDSDSRSRRRFGYLVAKSTAGQTFLILEPAADAGPSPIILLLNWELPAK